MVRRRLECSGALVHMLDHACVGQWQLHMIGSSRCRIMYVQVARHVIPASMAPHCLGTMVSKNCPTCSIYKMQ